MNAFVSKLLANKHTTGAALAYVVIEGLQQVACIWWPEHADKIFETARQISKGVVGYGLIMAGDAKPQLKLSSPPDDHTNP